MIRENPYIIALIRPKGEGIWQKNERGGLKKGCLNAGGWLKSDLVTFSLPLDG